MTARVSAYSSTPGVYVGNGQKAQVAWAQASFFPTLGVRPAIGRFYDAGGSGGGVERGRVSASHLSLARRSNGGLVAVGTESQVGRMSAPQEIKAHVATR